MSTVSSTRIQGEARLVTVDAIMATIAHEVKQPLSAMMMRAENSIRWLERPIPDVGKAKRELQHLAIDGHRAVAVLERIRANFKRDTRIRTLLDLNDLIDKTIALLLNDLQRHQIQVRAEPNAMLPLVTGDPIELQQVLVNLITNAIDAMASEEGHRLLDVRSEVRDDGGVMVSVSDTGAGVDAQDFERIFNPFFTTKLGGMGMGLSICRSIIEAHDGQLWAGPNTPRGTVFQFVLH